LEESFLDSQIVGEVEAGDFLTANDGGHVGGVGDVALEFGEGEGLSSLFVFAVGSGEGEEGCGVVERLDVHGASGATEGEVATRSPFDFHGGGADGDGAAGIFENGEHVVAEVVFG